MPAQRTSLYSAAGDGASFREWYDWELSATYGDLSKEYKAATQGPRFMTPLIPAE